MTAALGLHSIAATVWVGGMLLMVFVVRPVAVQMLAPADRIPFLTRCLGRFFILVWASIITLLISGFWMLFEVMGGFSAVAWPIHAMVAIGLLMMLKFLMLYFLPYRKLLAASNNGQWSEAAKQLQSIRRIVMANALLGLLVIILATIGRFL